MTKKILTIKSEYSSIYNDSKWLNQITIAGFTSRKEKLNAQLYNKILNLVKKYNGEN